MQQLEMLFAQLIGTYRTHRVGKAGRTDQIGQQDRRKFNRLGHTIPQQTRMVRKYQLLQVRSRLEFELLGRIPVPEPTLIAYV